MLLHNWDIDKTHFSPRDVALNRDGYDNCIADLDQQIGSMLDELDRRGVLDNTLVIITSDHGEEFGEHKVYNHGYSLNLYETHVPLLIISRDPGGPRRRRRRQPARRARDDHRPAGPVGRLALPRPVAGGVLATGIRRGPPAGHAALSEADFPTIALDPRRGRGPTQRGYTMSLVSGGWHYIRDGGDAEWLYNLADDPGETLNRLQTPQDLTRTGE